MKKNPVIIVLSEIKDYIPLVIVYSICISFLVLATPVSVQSLVNTFSFGPYFQPLFIISLLLLTFLILLTIVKSLQYILIENLQRKLYVKLSAKINRVYMIRKDLELPKDKVSIANRYFDVVIIQKKASYLISDLIAVFLNTGLGLMLISIYHPFFVIFSVLILMLLFAPIFILGSVGSETAVNESTAKYNMANWIEGLANKENWLDDNSVDEQINKADAFATSYLEARSSHFKIVFRKNIFYMACFAILNTMLLMLGGYLVISNQLSVGQLVAAEIVVNGILYHFLNAQKYLEAYYDLYAACSKVQIFYDIENKISEDQDQAKKSVFFNTRKYGVKFFRLFKSIRFVPAPLKSKRRVKKFGAVVAAVFLFISLAPWQQTSRGVGKVTALDPNDRVQFLTATVSGRIEKWLVQDGQFVKKGDPIVKILDNDPDFFQRLEAQRDAAVAKFEAAREASDTARINFHRQEKLVAEGLSSRKEFEKANITYKKLLSEEASAVNNLAKSEVQLSRQKLQEITAPRDGRILRILLGSGTVNVKTGDKLVQFVPETTKTAVEVFVNGNDLPLVYPGRKVRLQFEGWPAVQFSGWPSIAIGSFGGVVTAVDSLVSNKGEFRVLIVPDAEDQNEWPDRRFLRQGSRVLALVLLDEVSLGYEVWRQINGFPKSLDEEPMDRKNFGKAKKK